MKKIALMGVWMLSSATAFAASTPERAAVARRCAAESIVLLKNDGVLPLRPGATVDVVEQVGTPYMGCGQGSAWVHMPFVVDIAQGMRNAGFVLNRESRETAIWTVTRFSGEGSECKDFNDYYLSSKEQNQLSELKAAGYRKIVAILNVGTMISPDELERDPSVSAILYVSYPGMEGGNAIADILSGAVNPSGRLPVTVAARLEDYPSNDTWQDARHYVPYEEDIFLGYRYFCTIPGADKKVVYPFGHGLSYTTFTLSDFQMAQSADKIVVYVRVANSGKVPGCDSVLLYTSLKGGKVEHPSRELRAFAKTRLLAPGESETLELSFDLEALAYFDEDGASGTPGSWVVDEGEYSVWVGGTPADATLAGSFSSDQKILSTPGFKLSPSRLAKRLRADGSYRSMPVLYGDRNGRAAKADWPKSRPTADKLITLRQVAQGEKTLDEFVDQMPASDLLTLLYGQPNILPVGNTCSIGVLKEYGVPGLQTADGPVGIRLGQWPEDGKKPKPEQMATAFPATALTAGSFDIKLQEEYGRALGQEAAAEGIDIHLAPGICLARHPLCGRNFEYMGEDPYLAGRMAAAYIRGVQSQGVASTLKHLAGNNRENSRRESFDVVSERALRELYLKGFEIAVKEAKPKCLMTSYNGINGIMSSANFRMVEGILRDEWGFEGLVMTDWDALTSFWESVASGNDVKMPGIEPFGIGKEGCEKLKKFFVHMSESGSLSSRRLKASAKRVLKLVLDSARFKER